MGGNWLGDVLRGISNKLNSLSCGGRKTQTTYRPQRPYRPHRPYNHQRQTHSRQTNPWKPIPKQPHRISSTHISSAPVTQHVKQAQQQQQFFFFHSRHINGCLLNSRCTSNKVINIRKPFPIKSNILTNIQIQSKLSSMPMLLPNPIIMLLSIPMLLPNSIMIKLPKPMLLPNSIMIKLPNISKITMPINTRPNSQLPKPNPMVPMRQSISLRIPISPPTMER